MIFAFLMTVTLRIVSLHGVKGRDKDNGVQFSGKLYFDVH